MNFVHGNIGWWIIIRVGERERRHKKLVEWIIGEWLWAKNNETACERRKKNIFHISLDTNELQTSGRGIKHGRNMCQNRSVPLKINCAQFDMTLIKLIVEKSAETSFHCYSTLQQNQQHHNRKYECEMHFKSSALTHSTLKFWIYSSCMLDSSQHLFTFHF